jgi:hypothetical protein
MVFIIFTFLLFTFWTTSNAQQPDHIPVPEVVYTEQDKHRARFQLPPFIRDDKLSAIAQTLADKCNYDLAIDSALITDIQTRYANANGKVYTKGDYSQTVGINMNAASEDWTTASWLDDAKYWNCGPNTCAADQDCLGYTQTVWRNSVKIGCALSKCYTGSPWDDNEPWEDLICLYNPAGNYNNKHPMDVDLWRCDQAKPVSSLENDEGADVNHQIEDISSAKGVYPGTLSIGAIVGIVIAAVVGVIVVIVVIVKFRPQAKSSEDNYITM